MVRPGLGVVTSPFGPRFHPILHYVKVHTGIDFAAADGIVYAADDGVVLFTEYNVAYGNMTVIDHGTVGGLQMTTLYAHQAAIGVKPGDHVVKGQAIGVIGSTGYATGPHLHFEVRINGEPFDPAPFLVNAKLPTSLPDDGPEHDPGPHADALTSSVCVTERPFDSFATVIPRQRRQDASASHRPWCPRLQRSWPPRSPWPSPEAARARTAAGSACRRSSGVPTVSVPPVPLPSVSLPSVPLPTSTSAVPVPSLSVPGVPGPGGSGIRRVGRRYGDYRARCRSRGWRRDRSLDRRRPSGARPGLRRSARRMPPR